MSSSVDVSELTELCAHSFCFLVYDFKPFHNESCPLLRKVCAVAVLGSRRISLHHLTIRSCCVPCAVYFLVITVHTCILTTYNREMVEGGQPGNGEGVANHESKRQ